MKTTSLSSKKRVYFTVKRKQQYLYWKLLLSTFLLAVLILGFIGEYNTRYIASLHEYTKNPQIHFTSRVEAKTIEHTTSTLNSSPEANNEPKSPILKPNLKNPQEVEAYILALAKETNFKWPSYLVRLAKCESSLDPTRTNDNGPYGLDRGPFQINNKYHAEVSDSQAFDLEYSTRWTMNRINKGYQHEWACDKIIRGKKG